MDIALERGLAAQKVKVGDGEKTPGLAFARITIKKVIAGVFLVLGVMLLGTIWSYRVALRERYNAYVESKRAESSQIRGEAFSIAQNIQLEAALTNQAAAKDDITRILKRIQAYSKGKIDDAAILVEDPQVRRQVVKILGHIETYIQSEKDDFEKEYEVAAKKRSEQIKKLRKSQTQALEKLLNRVTDVRLEALEEMLTDLFERVQDSVRVNLEQGKWQELEDLVDKLYQEDFTVQEGLAEFEKIRPFFGEPGIPADLEKTLESATDQGSLADVLDEVYEGAQIFKGREQLLKIRDEWETMQKKADSVAGEARTQEEVQKAEQLYTRSTVNAVLDVQELINDGLIPQDFLDFEAIDLEEVDQDSRFNDENNA
mmetsp:Transcript_12866/g.20421  ORF Transcript_12866/g.20421 Transcript_12866/m.20421 type:complete len:372 (-) Transcript_12866:271-1386(-)